MQVALVRTSPTDYSWFSSDEGLLMSRRQQVLAALSQRLQSGETVESARYMNKALEEEPALRQRLDDFRRKIDATR